MEIEYSREAKKVKEKKFHIYFPSNIEECFNGTISNTGVHSPSIEKGLFRLNSVIQNIKGHPSLLTFKPSIKIDNENQFIKDPINNNFYFLKYNISIIAVTTEDAIKKTRVTVKNIFTDNDDSFEVPLPYGKPIPLNSIPEEPIKINQGDDFPMVDKLGIYIPKYGCILIYVDKISKLKNPELIFQKVLLHELIHALLDVNIRIINNNQQSIGIGNKEPIILPNNKQIDCNDHEEELTNSLTLFTYAFQDTPSYILGEIREFIYNQPYPYNCAITRFEEGWNKFREILLNYLIHKIQSEV